MNDSTDLGQLMFTWMAIDRTNVSGVLTSTFLADTGMTRDQANTGVSLLWFGIVLLEIPSNVSFPAHLEKKEDGVPDPDADHSPPHWTALLDPSTGRGLGNDRGPSDVRT